MKRMFSGYLSFLFALCLCSFILAAPRPAVAQEGESTAAQTGLDTCEIHEIPSSTLRRPVKCLVYIPGNLDLGKPVAALAVFPDATNQVDAIARTWGKGAVPESDSMLVIIPEIDPSLPKDSAFALFSEVMHGVKEKYSIDSQRLYLWGMGQGYRHAFYAARCLPDKFAAIVEPSQRLASPLGLLDFATLPVSVQISAVKRDPKTYELNLDGMAKIDAPPAAKGLASMTPALWGRIGESLKSISKKGNAALDKTRFRTDRLRFGKSAWISILDFKNWNIPGGFRAVKVATAKQPDMLVCHTENLEMLSIEVPSDVKTVRIDDSRIATEAGRPATMKLDGGKWRQIDPPAVVVTKKHPDRAGPLADTLFTPFVFAYGTKNQDDMIKLKEWALETAEAMPGKQIEIMSDTDVLADKETVENCTLVCFGDKEQNSVAAALPEKKLPGDQALAGMAGDGVHTYLQPSPFAMDRYIVVNNSANEEAYSHPARMNWHSDWAVYSGKSGQPRIVGCFNQDWEPEGLPVNPWAEFQF